MITNWPKDAPKPRGHGTQGYVKGHPLIRVIITDLIFANLRLEEAIVGEQSKYSLAALVTHNRSGKLEPALPHPADFDNMTPARQHACNASNYITPLTTVRGTVECRLRNARCLVEAIPTVVAMGMR